MPVGVSAYVPLATKTLTATQTSVTFSSISQAYRDLVLVIQAGQSTNNVVTNLSVNSDLAVNASTINMLGTGVAPRSGTTSVATTMNISGNASDAIWADTALGWLATVNIMDYSATDKHKSVLVRNGQTGTAGVGYGTSAIAGRFATTAAIVSMKIAPASGNFIVGSTFTLYGIASA